MEALSSFIEIRNRAAHGLDVEQADARKYADLGAGLLDTLRGIPTETVKVLAADLTLFSDETRIATFPDIRGVLLEVRGPSGDLIPQVYPTRRIYHKGDRVTWAWSAERFELPTWYEVPESGELKKAFDASLEFVGSVIDPE